MYTGRANTSRSNAGRSSAGTYTGTVISDLMAAVERAERRAERLSGQCAEQQRITEELQAIFSAQSFGLQSGALQIPVTENDSILIGAA